MEAGTSTDLLSITERMSRIRTRIYLEKVSGIAAGEKEAFLAYCQEQEQFVGPKGYRPKDSFRMQRDDSNFFNKFKKVNPLFTEINPHNVMSS